MLGKSVGNKRRRHLSSGRHRRVRFRLSEEHYLKLEREAHLRRVTINYLVGDMIEGVVGQPTADSAWETGLKLLSEVKSRQKILGTDLECMFETLCFYIYQWFCHSTPLPESQRRAAAVDGKIRFEKFLELVKGKLNEGRSPFSVLLEGEEEQPEAPEVANG